MNSNPGNSNTSDWLQVVRKNIRPVAFGSVQIVVHDSKVVQIDTKHKVRFLPDSPSRQFEKRDASGQTPPE
jgi:hypothetical protein